MVQLWFLWFERATFSTQGFKRLQVRRLADELQVDLPRCAGLCRLPPHEGRPQEEDVRGHVAVRAQGRKPARTHKTHTGRRTKDVLGMIFSVTSPNYLIRQS